MLPAECGFNKYQLRLILRRGRPAAMKCTATVMLVIHAELIYQKANIYTCWSRFLLIQSHVIAQLTVVDPRSTS